jgi:hypothetical protein
MRTTVMIAALASIAAMSSAHAAPAAPTHEYRFDGNLQDSLGGPDLQSLGGTVGAGTFEFPAGGGLTLDSALTDGADYAIEITARLDQISEFRRILDFKNGASDSGLYSFAATLSFLPTIFGSSSVFSTTDFATILVTRDGGTNELTGYANGTPQFSIADAGGLGIFSTPAARMVFFRDDNVFPGEEAGGSVRLIRIFDEGLSAAEVAALYAPIPEPGTWALSLVGLGLVAWTIRRSRSAGNAGR